MNNNSMNSFEKTIARYIQEQQLLTPADKIIIGLSGGADSVALLLVLHRLGYHIEAVHCNFHLRGDEADHDQAFCESLCRQLDVKLHICHFNTHDYAKNHKISIEMAAREQRYEAFERLRKEVGADAIAVAHHRDDNVETILMNLIRGCGLKGLRGMLPRRDNIVRPLLCVGRNDTEDYLRECRQEYVVDSTNLHTDYLRNKLRIDIIPLLKQLNPKAAENIARTAGHLRELEKRQQAQATAQTASQSQTQAASQTEAFDISINELRSMPSPEYELFERLQPRGFSPSQIQQIAHSLDADTGRHWLSATHVLAIDRGRLLLRTRQAMTPPATITLPDEGTYTIDPHTHIKIERQQTEKPYKPSTDPLRITVDAQRVTFPLTFRRVKPGDKISLSKSGGKKLVSDLMCDMKLTRFERCRQAVLVDSQQQVVWVVGRRVSAHAYVTPQTEQALAITLSTSI